VPDSDFLPETLDSVLRKYGKIWIWSILVAAAGGLTVRSLGNVGLIQWNAFPHGSSGTAAMYSFVALAVVVPQLASVISVWYLLLFLRHHILPTLFPSAPTREPGIYTDEELAVPPDGAQLLYRAFCAVVIAVAAECSIAFLSFVYRVVA
jgi:hypothetical protein